MRIAILVHGRFYAFDLARELIARNHDVTVFTNYPVWAAKRFGLPGEKVVSFWPHGVLTRAIGRLSSTKLAESASPALHQMFGKWAAKQVQAGGWDVVQAFSGIGEEALRSRQAGKYILVRGSSHIRVQARLLREESLRTGMKLEQPADWVVEREEREYQAADRIVVLSQFAHRSFVDQGIAGKKLSLLPLGVDTRMFRLSAEQLERRCKRILAGEPLNVLYTGTVSFRKGLFDLAKIVQAMEPGRFRFRFIGDIPEESRAFVDKFRASVECVPRQPESHLPDWYTQGDLFIFPTIEDGFAAVLTQAYAGALPILTTTNCGGPDLIREGKTGWVLPIREPEAFIERLWWCDSHREELADMVREIHSRYQPRDWKDVAADFEAICEAA